jgi:hypothetical protein
MTAGNGRTLMAIALAGFVLAGAAAAAARPSEAEPRCTVATLHGQYIFAGRSSLATGDAQAEHVHDGVFVFDGAGNLAGMQTSSRGGKVHQHEAIKGSYTLNADCTGTMTFDDRYRVGGEIHWDLFVTRDGRKGNMIRTDEGAMAVRSFEK